MSSIKIPLVNETGVDLTTHTIYVLGFSSTSQKQLVKQASTTTAKFETISTSAGNLNTYKLDTDITEIEIDMTPESTGSNTPKDIIDGARIYFFVAENKSFPNPPAIPFTNSGGSVTNVKNPPNPDVPPYTFAEFTLKDLGYGPVIDSQTVDGFVFPVNISVSDAQGTSLGSVGQPVTMTRKDVLNAYQPFLTALTTGGENKDYIAAFEPLAYTENQGGLLNPGAYLGEVSKTGEFKRLTSELNTMLDASINTLFSNDKLSIKGVSAGSIAADFYTSKSGAQQLPDSPFTHPALQLTGKSNGKVFTVFNPVGLCVLNSVKDGKPTAITGTIVNNTLTFADAIPSSIPLKQGMFIDGAGVPANIINISAIETGTGGAVTSVTLGPSYPKTADDTYTFVYSEKTTLIGTIQNTLLTFQAAQPADTVLSVGMTVAGAGVAGSVTIVSIGKNAGGEITSVTLSADLANPAPNSTYVFSKPPVTSQQEGSLEGDTFTFKTPQASGSIAIGTQIENATIIPITTTVSSLVESSGSITAVKLAVDLSTPAPGSQYHFSKVKGMFYSSGNMAFANQGVFAWAPGLSKDEGTVSKNLQNQLVTALNRGVANAGPSSGSDGYSTEYWGTQANWYPVKVPQNIFSLFMHTATTNDTAKTPLFIQATGSVACARGTIMGQSYGFAYDENAGPVPPAPSGQPEVPSKFDPLPSNTATVTISLGPWTAPAV